MHFLKMLYTSGLNLTIYGCLAGPVVTRSPLTAATRVRYPHVRWAFGYQVRQMSFLPHEDQSNANIDDNERD